MSVGDLDDASFQSLLDRFAAIVGESARAARRWRHRSLRRRAARPLSRPVAAGAETRQRRGGQPHPEARQRDRRRRRAAGRQYRAGRRRRSGPFGPADRAVLVAAQPHPRDRHIVEYHHRRGRRHPAEAARCGGSRPSGCFRCRSPRRVRARSAAIFPPMPAARRCWPMAMRANSASAWRSCCRPARCWTICASSRRTTPATI